MKLLVSPSPMNLHVARVASLGKNRHTLIWKMYNFSTYTNVSEPSNKKFTDPISHVIRQACKKSQKEKHTHTCWNSNSRPPHTLPLAARCSLTEERKKQRYIPENRSQNPLSYPQTSG
ncbi:hypothetical protein KC318_g68 [Hortaea werneckii]|nr:hypothetical protein KC334_g66 [Hortaea werneckii]KAI7028380.1 hypothetical protein KC355_g67 [Hortaea werneckii]KAI7676791.1 hypothetical protein KC318_g68 [Hortaea werneckii]